MPNIAKLFKDEIQRISRREIKLATTVLRRNSIALKAQIVELKKRLAKMEADNKHLIAGSKVEVNKPVDPNSSTGRSRITSKMIRSVRSRLGLSQQAFAKLIGVSSQAVYQWEHKQGRLRLRGESLSALDRVKKLGKRELKRLLAQT